VVYNVKKGDTLYKITKRYTGDGWNYPKVAIENSIPNADLIYPKQKIKVPK
jgi:nucleoid-associated protein YgaU